MQTNQIVAPTQEPLTLEEVKLFLGILDDDRDSEIMAHIISAREIVEKVTNRQLEIATFESISEKLFSSLPKGSLISVDKIEYLNSDWDYVELDPGKYYSYSENGIGKIFYLEFPTLQDHKQAIKVTFTCGYAEVPETLKNYMKIIVSTKLEFKEEYIAGVSLTKVDYVHRLLDPYKIRNI